MSTFSDLLLEAEKLTNNIHGTTDLPKVDRSLRQVLEASNELYSRVAQTGSKDIQANLLLGSKGIDLPKISQKLDVIASKPAFETIELHDALDIDAYLNAEIRNCIMTVIEDEHKKCYQQVMEDEWKHRQYEWKQEKRKILNAMTAPSGTFVDTSRHNVMFNRTPTVNSNLMNAEEAVYSAKIEHVIKSGTKGQVNMVDYLATAAESFKDKKINEMWDMLKYMTNIPAEPGCESVVANRYSKPVQSKLVSSARLYLEDRYKTYMGTFVDENRIAAQRGGIPGTYPLVRSFVALKFHGDFVGLENGLIDGRPFWPMVYYCLRSGDLQAVQYCLQMSQARFPPLASIIDIRLKQPDSAELSKLEETLRFEYRRSTRNSTDPFKRIVWAILGCCDVADEHSEVAQTVDDYLWVKLNLVRSGYGKNEHINFNELQRTILEDYGESHYDALRQPHLYFQVLILTSQFEAAMEFLFRIDRYRVHAVHMAIALNEMYLLAGPLDYSSPLIFVDPEDPVPARRLNIVRLLLLYVRNFETSCIGDALNYFYLLHNVNTSSEETPYADQNMYVTCVADLALETKEYEQIFGKIQPNGIRTRGLLDAYEGGPRLSTQHIATVVAEKLVKRGSFEDAIKLYDIAQNQTEVIKLVCALQCQVVHLPKEFGSLRDRLELLADEIETRYGRDGYHCDVSSVSTFTTLSELFRFFNNYHAKQFNIALKIIQDLRIIPLQSNEVNDCIDRFRRINADLKNAISDILLATMNILYSQYQNIKSNELIPNRSDVSLEKQLVHIRTQAKVLTNFSGLIPYRLPGDTNSRLGQLEILMH